MLTKTLQKVILFRLLHRIDIDLANLVKQARCPFCNGPLHHSNYMRKPRGGPKKIPDEYLIRFSLCCGNEGCRRRCLPPSCLFMGRRVYFGCVILVILTLQQNRPNGASARKLQQILGISRQTLKRWIEYFREEFPVTTKWQRLRGRVASSIDNRRLPSGLVNYFMKNIQSPKQAIIGCLKFLASG